MARTKLTINSDGERLVKMTMTVHEAEFVLTVLGQVYPAYCTEDGYEKGPFLTLDATLNKLPRGERQRVRADDIVVASKALIQALTNGERQYVNDALPRRSEH